MKDLDIAVANCDKILLEKLSEVVTKWACDVPCDYYLGIWQNSEVPYHLSILYGNIDYSSQALSKRPSLQNKKAVANILATSTHKEY